MLCRDEQVESQYENADTKVKNVTYLECSARSKHGLERVILTCIRRMRELVPDRDRIRASRLRDRGQLGELKRQLYTCMPCFMHVEDALTALWRRTKPIREQLTCLSWLWKTLFGASGLDGVPQAQEQPGGRIAEHEGLPPPTAGRLMEPELRCHVVAIPAFKDVQADGGHQD